MSFWIKFAISEALTVATLLVSNNTKLTPEQKIALENFISSGNALLNLF